MGGVGNLDHEPAVPIPFTGIRFVLLSRLLRIPFEIRKESSGPLGIMLFRPIPRSRTAIAGTAAAVTPRAVASVPLKSLRTFFGRFEIVSSASDRAAAGSEKNSIRN